MMAKPKTTLRPGTEWDLYLDRQEARWGDKFDTSDLASQFIPYFRTGQRIKVLTRANGGQHERTGNVGVTTGWKPSFMLLHRKSDRGSWDLLGPDDEVVAVQQGRNFVPVPADSDQPTEAGANVARGA